MYQGTTPTIPITFKGIDLSEAKIFLSIYDGKELKTLVSGEDFTVQFDGTDTKSLVTLTQEMTLSLSGLCTMQARFIFQDGTAGATKKQNFLIRDVLLKDLIKYEEEVEGDE